MTSFIIEDFGGKNIKQDPRMLPEGYAQVATDCELDRAALRGLAADPDAGVGSVAANTVYMYWQNRNTWLDYAVDANVCKAPIANDLMHRLVETRADLYPKVIGDTGTYRVGIPAPENAPIVSPQQSPGAGDDASILSETIAYVYTFVDAWGVEGPPSPPSAIDERVIDTPVDLTFSTPPNGSYNFGAGALKRFYRSSSGAGTASYLYAGEVPIATNSFTDVMPNSGLAEMVPSVTWVGPPDDDTSLYPDGPLQGIIPITNGILGGFSGRTLCFSEPFLYHAWPFEYRITIEEDIIGMVAITSGVLVVTGTRPYIVSGVHPASMAVLPLDEHQGLVSKRGLVDMGTYAIYPSPDGLVLVENMSARLATNDMLTHEQWQTYDPTNITAFLADGKYVGFSNGKGFIFDPRGGKDALIDINREYVAGFFDGPTGRTLLATSSGAIKDWGANPASPATYIWRSAKKIAPQGVSMSVARLTAWDSLASNPITMRVYADGVLTDTVVFNEDVFSYKRLSSGFRAKLWEFELEGTNPVTYAGLFEAMQEVR